MEQKSRTDLIVEELQRLKGLGGSAAVEEEKSKFVVFALNDGLYAFAGADVREILPPAEVFPVPGAPKDVPGLIINRGEVEAVIDIHGVLGLPAAAPTAAGRVVVAEKGGVRSGVRVDAVLDVLDIPASEISPPLATLSASNRELVLGTLFCHGRSAVLLDVGRIFDRLRAHVS